MTPPADHRKAATLGPTATPSSRPVLTAAFLHPAPELAELDRNRSLIEHGTRVAANSAADWVLSGELVVPGYRFEPLIGTNWIEEQPDSWIRRLAHTTAGGPLARRRRAATRLSRRVVAARMGTERRVGSADTRHRPPDARLQSHRPRPRHAALRLRERHRRSRRETPHAPGDGVDRLHGRLPLQRRPHREMRTQGIDCSSASVTPSFGRERSRDVALSPQSQRALHSVRAGSHIATRGITRITSWSAHRAYSCSTRSGCSDQRSPPITRYGRSHPLQRRPVQKDTPTQSVQLRKQLHAATTARRIDVG
jgi:hypothetical protein